MNKWKDISIKGIAKIEKCVAEFDIWELYISPYAKFKIKIFEDKDSSFTGYTNLRLIDKGGDLTGPVGYGSSIEEALEDTINQFFLLTSYKEPKEWVEEDFECTDSFDF
jgi:hypothetical protein